MAESDFFRSIQETMLLFPVHEDWPECAARQMQRILIIQSVTNLERCNDALIARLVALVTKEGGRRRERRARQES